MNRVRIPHIATFFLATLLLPTQLSCGGDKSTNPQQVTPCGGAVTVSISAGTTPTFTWTPSCSVWGLLVERDAEDQWGIMAASKRIRSGVQYGVTPSGTTVTQETTALESGVTYEVILFSGTNEQDAEIIATREFTP